MSLERQLHLQALSVSGETDFFGKPAQLNGGRCGLQIGQVRGLQVELVDARAAVKEPRSASANLLGESRDLIDVFGEHCEMRVDFSEHVECLSMTCRHVSS